MKKLYVLRTVSLCMGTAFGVATFSVSAQQGASMHGWICPPPRCRLEFLDLGLRESGQGDDGEDELAALYRRCR